MARIAVLMCSAYLKIPTKKLVFTSIFVALFFALTPLIHILIGYVLLVN